MVEKLYRKWKISDSTDFSMLSPNDYPILSDLYELIEYEYQNYDNSNKPIYTESQLQEILLGIHSMCVGAESKFFNGHTNIMSDRFVVFGVKGLLEASKNIKNALLFGVKPDDVKQVLEKALSVIKMTRDEFEKFNHSYQNTIKYKMKENMPRKYEAVIIFNKPMLFTNERLENNDIPDGLHRYDIRDGGMDGNMCELKDYVAVNHWGTVLSRDMVEPRLIDGKEMNSKDGIVMTDDDYNYTGEEFTSKEYLEKYDYLVDEYCEPEENMEMRM